MMLYSGCYYMLPIRLQNPGRTADCQIDTLRSATCENNLACFAFPDIGNPFTRVIQKGTDLPANTVNAGGIAIKIPQKG